MIPFRPLASRPAGPAHRVRRPLRVAAPLLALTFLLGACGGGDTDSGDGRTVVIEHALGTTTIEAEPKRVVALGSADVQIAIALGADIVGAAKNDYSDDGQWVGVEPALDDDVTLLPAIEPDLEQIVALEPDLILITSAQPGYAEKYDALSKIAPTVAYREGLLEDSGEDLVTMIGKALGKDERARDLIESSQAAMTTWRDEHPELVGQKIAFGQFVGGKTYIVVADTAPSTVFYAELGMPLSQELAKLPVQAPPGISVIDDENLDLLDTVDHLVLGVGSSEDEQTFLDRPVLRNSVIAKDGRTSFVDFTTGAAILAPSPATTGFILDQLDALLASS